MASPKPTYPKFASHLNSQITRKTQYSFLTSFQYKIPKPYLKSYPSYTLNTFPRTLLFFLHRTNHPKPTMGNSNTCFHLLHFRHHLTHLFPRNHVTQNLNLFNHCFKSSSITLKFGLNKSKNTIAFFICNT